MPVAAEAKVAVRAAAATVESARKAQPVHMSLSLKVRQASVATTAA